MRDSTSRIIHNADIEWNYFEPEDYWRHNYISLRSDDSRIIEIVAEFMSDHFSRRPSVNLRGVDVGTGSNLYPAMAMLPWCDSVALYEYAESNISWLKNHVFDYDGTDEWSWRPFWEKFSEQSGYASMDWRASRTCLAERLEITQRSIFHLEGNAYDIGTLFFVAESITSDFEEFRQALTHFIRALKPGAPFAAAFMDSSIGYKVNGKEFPAVHEVTTATVELILTQVGAVAEVTKIDIPASEPPLRDGYDGMIVAVGLTPDG